MILYVSYSTEVLFRRLIKSYSLGCLIVVKINSSLAAPKLEKVGRIMFNEGIG